MKPAYVVFVVLALSLPAAVSAADAVRPNVVYLLADDLGWGDLGANGGSIPTPHLDRLAAQGVRLENFMGWCVCSPTRAMLLTGRHPFRVGTGPEVGGELAREETTIAEAFRAHGYRTGVFGKWHNGDDPDTDEYRAAFAEAFRTPPNKKPKPGLGANEHGFDEAWVYYGGGADYFTRRTVGGRGPVSWWHNREYRPHDVGYTEDLITGHVLDFVRENKNRPFFCYVPFHLVHAPMQAKAADLANVDAALPEVKRTYAAMVQALDKNVGAILGELDQLGLLDNTIVVFTSDNGATKEGSNLPFRGGKHSMYEGGTRLPTILHWPSGGLQERSWDGLCGALDMFPTLLAMAGLPLPDTRPLDGKNFWPAMRDNGPSPIDSYYWAWHNEDVIRTDKWRLHRYFDRVELYDIRADAGEASDVADSNPEVVRSLTAKMNAWTKSLQAALSHQPAPAELDSRPAPEGEVLEISVTVAEKAKPKDFIVVPITTLDIPQTATDYVEFDVAVSNDTPLKGAWFYSPFKGNTGTPPTVLFRKGEGIDQFGREQSTAPPIRGELGTWEHRVIGLCSIAPGTMPRNGLVFRGGRHGTYKVYVDNLRLRHADGSITLLWTKAEDTRTQKIADSELFQNVRVRAVSAMEVE